MHMFSLNYASIYGKIFNGLHSPLWRVFVKQSAEGVAGVILLISQAKGQSIYLRVLLFRGLICLSALFVLLNIGQRLYRPVGLYDRKIFLRTKERKDV